MAEKINIPVDKNRKVKAIEIQARFAKDTHANPYKNAYEFAESLRLQFPYVRIIKTFDGMATKNVKLIKEAYYVENHKLPLRSYEVVIDAWYEGKKIINLKHGR